MLVRTGHILYEKADAVVIPTQGLVLPTDVAYFTNIGVDKLADRLWPGFAYAVGKRLRKNNRIVHLITNYDRPIPTLTLPASRKVTRMRKVSSRTLSVEVPTPYHIVVFPVRYGTAARSNISLSLLRQSCILLMDGIQKMKWSNVLLAKPVLYDEDDHKTWAKAMTIMRHLLDDRVTLVEAPTDDDSGTSSGS